MILLAVVATVLLAGLHLSKIITSSIQFDDAFFANVAKNLVVGNGYSSSKYQILSFDPDITTGPVLVLPAAALMLVFGNQYWVPNLAYVLCVWTLLALVLSVLRRRLSNRPFAAATLVMTVGLLVFSTQEFGLLGEIPAALLVVLGGLAISDSRPSATSPVLAGLALGCAITTKTVAALAIPVFIACLFIHDKPGGAPLHRLRWFLFGVVCPLLLLETWKLIAQGSIATWAQLKGAEFELMFGGGSLSGATTVRSVLAEPRILAETIVQNSATLANDWGGWLALLAACSATLAAGWMRGSAEASGSASVRITGFLLLGAAVTHAAWWLAFSPTAWARHLLPGVMYWLAALAVLIAVQSGRSLLLAATSSLLLLVALTPQLQRVSLKTGVTPDARLSALIATSDRVRQMQNDPDVVLLGCGWWHNPDVDYLLPSAANFKDCSTLAPQDVVDKKLVLVHSEFFNWERSLRLQRFQESCDSHVLFKKPPFVVSECPGLP